jgi:hypothetical protein
VRPPVLYDMLDMAHKPADSGFAPIYQVNRTWWPARKGKAIDKSVVDLDACRKQAAILKSDRPLIVNIEDRWDAKTGEVRLIRLDLREPGVTLDDVIEDTEFCLSVVRAYREGGFKGPIGFYGFIPGDATNDLILNRHREFPRRMARWKAANEFHASPVGLLSGLDVVCPSLYCGQPKIADWQKWAGPTLDEAKRFGKPVLAFVQPHYHPQASGGYAGKPLDQGMWQAQLDMLAEKEVDGVLWLGGDSSGKVDWESGPDFLLVAQAKQDLWREP